MKQTTITGKVLLLLLLLWLIIAVSRTVFNVSKVFTEERAWYGLTYEEKREKQFGDIHHFLRFVETKTEKNSEILFFTDDLKAYYLGRYYLYPTKVIGENELIWDPNANYYDYILIYPKTKALTEQANEESNIQSYKEFAVYKGISGKEGVLYKK